MENTKNNELLQIAEEEIEEKKEEHANIDFKMIGFSLAGKDYAIDIMRVKEIATAGVFTFVPNTAPFVLGVYNLRGDIIPIIDLRIFFNIEVPERTSNKIENMIIVSVDDCVFGVAVDAIDKVVGIQKKTIQPPHPLFGDINIKYIYGVVESNDRLYILLDIEQVFGMKTRTPSSENSFSLSASNNTQQAVVKKDNSNRLESNTVSESDRKKSNEDQEKEIVKDDDLNLKKAVLETPKNQEEDIDYTFIIDSLANLRGFYVSEVNESWFKQRYKEWVAVKGKENSQLLTESQADEFLTTFYSRCSDVLWDDEYINNMVDLLPENSASQIKVWNPGCGKGLESFSLSCVLHKKYPNAKIRIYAQDIDLLNISNAPLITLAEDKIPAFFKPYIIKTVKGGVTFSKEIKDSIQFGYHDCTHTNTNPNVDFIFMRDVLSFILPENRNKLFLDMEENLKGNGMIIIGDNEVLADQSKWLENSVGALNIYSKI